MVLVRGSMTGNCCAKLRFLVTSSAGSSGRCLAGGWPAAELPEPPSSQKWKSQKAPVKFHCDANSKVFNGGRFGKARGLYNLAWVPWWGRGVNLSSPPRQRRRFRLYMASGTPLRPFLEGCSEGQKVAVSEDRGEHMIIAADTNGFYGGEGMSLRACQGFLCGQSCFLPPPVCKFISVNLLHPSWRRPCASLRFKHAPKSTKINPAHQPVPV